MTCLIDWQHTIVQPWLLAAGYPHAFENPDPAPPEKLVVPALPPDYDTFSPEQKADADELHRRRLTFYFYYIFNGHLNKAHLKALRDPLLLPRQHLVDRASRQWSGDLMTLKGALVRMVEYWPLLPDIPADTPCPVQFPGADLEGFAQQEKMWFGLNKLVAHWKDQIGVSDDGWVSNEGYEEALEKIKALKKELLDIAEGDEEDIQFLEKGWPFRDREETS